MDQTRPGVILVCDIPKEAGRVLSMCEYEGNLFLAAENGVYRYDREHEKLELVEALNPGVFHPEPVPVNIPDDVLNWVPPREFSLGNCFWPW